MAPARLRLGGAGATEMRADPDIAAALVGGSHLEVTIEDLIAEVDGVAARIYWYGSLSNGGAVARETLDIIRVTHGRAVEHWETQLWATADQDSGETGGVKEA